jgi:hypothetical protein
MITVLGVAGDKLATTQIAERKVLDTPKIALTQQLYHEHTCSQQMKTRNGSAARLYTTGTRCSDRA